MFRLFLHLLEATECQPFTQRSLQDLGIPQYRQALTLLRGLELTTAAGRLQDDVLASRHDPGQFKSLLCDRIRKVWIAAGCSDEELSFLGQDLPGKLLVEKMQRLAPIRHLKNESARSAARSTLRALSDLLVHLPNRDWFENELRALEAKEEAPAPRAERERASGPQRDPLSARPAPVRGRGGAAAAETAGDVIRRILDTPAESSDVCEGERFIVDFSEEGDPVYAHVVSEVPWTHSRLLRFARQIQTRAEAMRRP
ncbi:MAG: hypothetical protein ACLQNE_15705 [Thermoguttaceae bacterium]